MNIAVVGASGMIGSRLVSEAASRGHHVIGICRHPENVPRHEKVRAVAADVMDTAALTLAFVGLDAVFHAYTTPPDPEARGFIMKALAGPNPMATIASFQPADPAAFEAHVKMRIDAQVAGTKSIMAAAKACGVKRILAVGGAGTLRYLWQ
jgi:putative NADH-flavin reductase